MQVKKIRISSWKNVQSAFFAGRFMHRGYMNEKKQLEKYPDQR